MRQGILIERPRSRGLFENPKRLSATDISALASMKNVAKCDTWCELQNPVNHRVFERKLRPKPPGQGHVCLGVTQRRSLPPLVGTGRERNMASRVLPLTVGPNTSPRCGARHGLRWLKRPLLQSRACDPARSEALTTRGARSRQRRDPRSGGITR
jgi:hypothetical protein